MQLSGVPELRGEALTYQFEQFCILLSVREGKKMITVCLNCINILVSLCVVWESNQRLVPEIDMLLWNRSKGVPNRCINTVPFTFPVFVNSCIFLATPRFLSRGRFEILFHEAVLDISATLLSDSFLGRRRDGSGGGHQAYWGRANEWKLLVSSHFCKMKRIWDKHTFRPFGRGQCGSNIW